MIIYKLTGTIKYIDARGNPAEAPFSYEIQCSSNHDEQKRLIIAKWLLDDAPLLVSSGDISDIEFRAVALTDEEMASKYGAVQKGLGI